MVRATAEVEEVTMERKGGGKRYVTERRGKRRRGVDARKEEGDNREEAGDRKEKEIEVEGWDGKFKRNRDGEEEGKEDVQRGR